MVILILLRIFGMLDRPSRDPPGKVRPASVLIHGARQAGEHFDEEHALLCGQGISVSSDRR